MAQLTYEEFRNEIKDNIKSYLAEEYADYRTGYRRRRSFGNSGSMCSCKTSDASYLSAAYGIRTESLSRISAAFREKARGEVLKNVRFTD